MASYEYRQLYETADTYAVKLQDCTVLGVAGPLSHQERLSTSSSDFTFTPCTSSLFQESPRNYRRVIFNREGRPLR